MQGGAGRLTFYYSGFAILAATLIGGGTEQGLWSDHLIEAILVPATIIGFGGLPESRFGVAGKALALLLVALCAFQFAPIPRPWPPQGADATMSVLFSPAPGRSLEAAVYLLTMLGFALFVSRLSDRDQERLTSFLFMGLAVNAAVGALQLSFARQEGIVGLLPYAITSAIFANENHLSAFVVAMIPISAWRLLGISRSFLTYLAVVAGLLIFLFAVGSRAGMTLSVGVAVLMIVWFATSNVNAHVRAAFALAGLTGLFAGIYVLFGSQMLAGDLREVFFRHTIAAIRDYWPLGSGMGTFRLIYPLYENPDEIISRFANQAHNDFLQATLETGVAGVALFAGFVLLSLRGLARTKLTQAAFISVVALLLHSLVDYPLRTAANALLFAFLAGVLLTRNGADVARGTNDTQ